MNPMTEDTKRSRAALVVASAMTTLAAGVTIAALSGYLHPSRATTPVVEPSPAGTADATAVSYAAYVRRDQERDDEDDMDDYEGRDDD